MLNLLSSNQKPTNCHHTSATSPQLFDFKLSPVGQHQSQSHEAGTQSHVRGSQSHVLDVPITIPESYSPPRPPRTHQRSFTEKLRSSQTLPPLLTSDSERGASPHPRLAGVHRLDPPTQLEQSANSPEHSRRSSQTRGTVTADSLSVEATPNKISSWFTGESAPIKVGLVPSPTKEKADPLEAAVSTSAGWPNTTLHRRSTSQMTPKPAMASRFSFFNSKASLAKSSTPSIDLGDELYNLDPHAALFPAGPPDPFSPAAFKNLQQQAEGILNRLQTAYRQRTIALRDMAAEKETLAEETEGAEMRARHLKLQLDDMAVKVAAQDEAMMNLVDELAQEKLARREEVETRKRSVRLVDATSADMTTSRLRRSDTVSDSGFESEDDSCADSVFSRREGAHSPTMSMSSVSTSGSPDSYQPPEMIQSPSHAARLRAPAAPAGAKAMPGRLEPVQEGCSNCHGVRASDAWIVLSVIKEENQGLKQRVGELEGALDGCLDVVGRLGE